MPKKDEEHRKRVVVEEIKEPQETAEAEEAQMPAKIDELPAEEVKEESTEENKSPEPEKPKEEKKEEAKEPKSESPKATEEKKSLWYIFWIMIPVAIIVGALAGGVFYFLNSVNKNASSSTPTPIESSLPTPSSSPSAEVDLAKYQIKVLNGSGIAGEAGKVQDLLTTAGFKVSGTGNADSYNFTDTVLQTRTSIDSVFVTKLSETLSKKYSVDPKTQSLPSGETSDVIVLVGSSKAAQ
ncbi:LytR C-terminal domain-containing protein [Patescibacteria group bacterium]|nr:LytR C-terminal domain-containing protein [Patescibacteria group bacterium]